jgi:hypothetical protein
MIAERRETKINWEYGTLRKSKVREEGQEEETRRKADFLDTCVMFN